MRLQRTWMCSLHLGYHLVGGGRIFTRGGDISKEIQSGGRVLSYRIFSPTEKISGGKFCPVTQAH